MPSQFLWGSLRYKFLSHLPADPSLRVCILYLLGFNVWESWVVKALFWGVWRVFACLLHDIYFFWGGHLIRIIWKLKAGPWLSFLRRLLPPFLLSLLLLLNVFFSHPQATVEPDIWGGLASRCFLDSILSAESDLVLLPFVSLWSQPVTQTI